MDKTGSRPIIAIVQNEEYERRVPRSLFGLLPQLIYLPIYLVFWLLVSPNETFAQSSFTYINMITTRDGLPSDVVNCVTQDNDGFLWIGTNKGLCRYDGSYVKIFNYEPGNTSSLCDDRVRQVLADGDFLWVATHMGLSRLNLNTGKFRSYKYNTRTCAMVPDTVRGDQAFHAFFLEKDGTLWVGSQDCGFARYDRAADTFEFFLPDTVAIPDPYETEETHERVGWARNILSLQADFNEDSIIWVGSTNGLFRFNKGTKQFKLYSHKPAGYTYQQLKSINVYRSMYQHPDGRIFSGAWHSNVVCFDPVTETFEHLRFQNDKLAQRIFHGVQHIVPHNDTAIWITSGGGLGEYNIVDKNFNFILENDNDNHKYYGCEFVDDQNRKYYPTIYGLTVFDPIQQQFELCSFKPLNPGYWGLVFGITHDVERNRYSVCSRQSTALFHLDIKTRQWTKTEIPFYKDTLYGSLHLNNLSKRNDGKYILATTSGPLIYDPVNESVAKPPVRFNLQTKVYNDIYVDSRDVAWISTRSDGVFTWDMNSNTTRQYLFPGESQGTASSETATFIEDSRGRIWMKRRYAFSIYYPVDDTIKHYLADDWHSAYNNTWAEDAQGFMWGASVDGWIGAIDMDSVENGFVRRIQIGNDNNPIYGFGMDQDGYMWCALQDFLAKADPVTGLVDTFRYDYGEDPSDCFTLEFMEDGMMVFGNRSQIVIANPRTLTINKQLPKPYITSINLGAQPIEIDTVANRLQVLNLKPSENFFSIGFSSISLSLGESNSIFYRLVGFQDEWHEAVEARVANYTNVPSGNYTFELRACNNEGLFNDNVFQLPITIGTPWYRTWIARILGILLLGGLIYGIYRYRINQIRKEERMRTEFQKQLANVEMSALRAQMNPHFIFNCLNSIESFVIKNDTLRASTYLNDFARLIRLILQNSRSSLVSLEDELEALELYLQMESLRFSNRFNYELNISENVDSSSIEIPPMLLQPYVENAIWHGLIPKDGQGNLKIELTRKNGMLHCSIEDDGIGRERSGQIRATRSVKGKRSMGMSITQDRIQLLNTLYNTNTKVLITDLKDNSGNAAGTRVELTIPV